MNFKDIAQKGIDSIRKKNQQHQLPLSSLKSFGNHWKKKNAVYGIIWSIDRKEHLEFIKELSYTIDKSSSINVKCDDPFVMLNLEHELKYLTNVELNNMSYDLPAGNPIFYERSEKASGSRVGNALAFDKHIQSAVKNKTGKFKENGPFVTDLSWFQGEQGQGSFRRWLFGTEFGLKNIIILDNKEFDVSDQKGLCMFYGEDGYDGDITVKNLINGTEFTRDFRSIGYIILNEDLATLLPSISTKTKYDWKRTSNQLSDIPEVKGGKIRVLGTMLLNQDPTFYYTDEKYIQDWTDYEEERFATRYQPATSHNRFYEIAVGTVIPPKTIIPGGLHFTYVKVDAGTGEQHKKHVMSKEVTQILKATRTGKSLHKPQTIWVPYATEFTGFTDNDRKIINNL
jgi:hypothetical protein